MQLLLVLASMLPLPQDASAPAPAPPVPDAFYTQRVAAGGIPILGSARVPPQALARARDIAAAMLAHRPDLRGWMAANGYRIAVMAEEEGTLDLPEQRNWKKPAPDDPRLTPCERKHYAERIGRLSDRDYWNARARGMGGPLTSVGAENLLGKPGTRYFGQNVLVHEFAHAILRAAAHVDPALHARVTRAYRNALAAGRWRGEYAAVSVEEYWAVGTQLWFETGPLVRVDGRSILSPENLAAYDPDLHAALAMVYGASHRIAADVFHRHPARVPPGPPPHSTAEAC
jgi:hypothetical protein